MKKIWVLMNLIFLSVLFSACSPISKDSNPTIKKQNIAISTMDTFIGGEAYASDETWKNVYQEMKDMYALYHELTDNFRGYDDVVGVYYINELVASTKMDQTVEIRKELYDLLALGLELEDFTDGYFNMSMGKIIDVWKDLIDDYLLPGEIISPDLIDHALSVVDKIDIIEDAISLHTEDDKYFVTLKYGAKIDLGALAKGYVTQLAADLLKANDIKTFLLSGGGSSMIYGEGNPSRENGVYNTGLINPQDVIDNLNIIGHRPKYYGIYSSTNYNMTTSGSYNQFILSEDVMYHHIISPKTKKPENYYLTLSIVGDDAGWNDGLSTAMFSMPPDVLESFVNEHNLETFTYLFKKTYKAYNLSDNFKEIK